MTTPTEPQPSQPQAASADATNLSGQTIKGYALQELVGQGGFGAVYRAEQALVRREVAIKVILPQYVNNPEFIRRFEAEAQLVAHLEHLHIVPLYDYWRDASGAFLVMRWLRGGNLREVLKRGHWPLDDVTRVVDQIAAALDAAHRAGVIHRDLKPANILLDEQKNAFLADFGIAKDLKRITAFAEQIEEDEEGAFMGSADYVSPEQIRAEALTPAADIYSFGILVYHMLTGQLPFPDYDVVTLISAHLTEPLPDIRQVLADLPGDLNEVIERATEKDPAQRYQSAPELAQDLRRILSSDSQAIADLRAITMSAFDLSELDGFSEMVQAASQQIFDPVNPYKGLRAFQQVDAADFFGRDALIERLLARLHEHDTETHKRFLSVIGPSGSGKSSAIKAGLLPRLRQGAIPGSEDWFYAEITPSAHPLEELEVALLRIAVNPPPTLMPQLNSDQRGLLRAVRRVLPDDGTELCLYIDQFEELFTLVADSEAGREERRLLLDMLRTAASDPTSRVHVIISLRADFYDRPLSYPDFGELVRQTTEVVLPLNRRELREAIEKPAERVGLQLEEGLADEILVDVGDQPGTLPLLQYALTELYEQREDNRLTRDAYQRIGGVSGALAKRAELTYQTLSDEHKRLARQIFLRLVTLGEGVEDTRRRALLAELLALSGDSDATQQIVDLFAKNRLLTLDHDSETRSPTVEVAHEALIRQWGTLRAWIADNRDVLRLQRQVALAAREWDAANRDRSFLASGARLTQFETLSSSSEQGVMLALTMLESAYIQASIQRRANEQAEQERRRAEREALEQRAIQRLRLLVVGAVFAALVAIGLTLAVNQQRTEADANASAFATSERIAAQNAATAVFAQDRAEQEALTATVAQGRAEIEATNAAISAADAQRNYQLERRTSLAASAQLALADGDTELALLLALQANAVSEPNTQSLRVLSDAAYAPGTRQLLDAHTDRVMFTRYSPDASTNTALTGGQDNRLILWDLDTGTIIHDLQGHSNWVWDAAFHPAYPDVQQAVSASADGTLILWDLATGAAIREFAGPADDPDTERLEAHDDMVRSVQFFLLNNNSGAGNVSGDNNSAGRLLSGGQDGTAHLWDSATGDLIETYAAGSPIYDVAVAPSGFTMLSAQEDGTIRFWLLNGAANLQTFNQGFEFHTGEVWALAYLPDETGFITASDDGTLLRWSLETGVPTQTYRGHSTRVTDLDIAANGRHMASAAEDNSLIVWDVNTGAVRRRLLGHDFLVYGVSFAPDGRRLLSGAWDTTVREWDLDHGAQVGQLDAHDDGIWQVAYRPDGQLAASAARDGRVSVFGFDASDRTQGLRLRRQLTPPDADVAHAGGALALAWQPDAARNQLLTGGADKLLKLWDAETGTLLRTFEGHSQPIWTATFSPDGRLIASGSRDNTIILWDAQTGAQLDRLFGHRFRITDLAFGPDGRRLASSSFDNTVLLWQISADGQGEQIEPAFNGHADWVRSVAFSPDGNTLLTAAADNEIILWDARFGDRLRTLEGHAAQVRDAHFTPDGQRVISAGDDDLILIWDVATGRILQQLRGHADGVSTLSLHPDGQRILSGAGDASVRQWRLKTSYAAIVDFVQAKRYVPEPTCAERQRYSIAPLCAEPTPVILSGES